MNFHLTPGFCVTHLKTQKPARLDILLGRPHLNRKKRMQGLWKITLPSARHLHPNLGSTCPVHRWVIFGVRIWRQNGEPVVLKNIQHA